MRDKLDTESDGRLWKDCGKRKKALYIVRITKFRLKLIKWILLSELVQDYNLFSLC